LKWVSRFSWLDEGGGSLSKCDTTIHLRVNACSPHLSDFRILDRTRIFYTSKRIPPSNLRNNYEPRSQLHAISNNNRIVARRNAEENG